MNKGDLILSIASYNIHQCVGGDGKEDPDRIIRVLQELDCSIVGLQEVSSRTGGDPNLSQLHYLANAVRMEPVPGPTVIRGDSHYGNVLLTRFPVEEISRQDLSMDGREPRGTVEAVFNLSGKKLRIIVTHLGLNADERKKQVRLLVKGLDRETATVLLGDINEWIPLRSCLTNLNDCFGRVRGFRTFPAHFPIFALDRIWTLPPSLMQTIEVHKSKLARIASDHLPLKVTIRL